MNLRIFRYYTIKHPFIKNKKIIISNRSEIKKTRNKVFEISRNRNLDRPRLLRAHISGKDNGEKNDSNRIILYEQIFYKKDIYDFNKTKLFEILNFSKSFVIAYFLFLAPESFWLPIVSLFNLIAHGLSDYARWCIIVFFPIKAIIQSFGTLIYIKTPEGIPNIGIPGNWHKIHESSKAVTLYNELNKPVKKKLLSEITILIKNLKSRNSEQIKMDKWRIKIITRRKVVE